MWIYDFLKFLFIYFNWRIITILWWFLLYINTNQPQVYMCSPPILNPPPTSLPTLPLWVVPEHRLQKKQFFYSSKQITLNWRGPTYSEQWVWRMPWLNTRWRTCTPWAVAVTPASPVLGWLPTITNKTEPFHFCPGSQTEVFPRSLLFHSSAFCGANLLNRAVSGCHLYIKLPMGTCPPPPPHRQTSVSAPCCRLQSPAVWCHTSLPHRCLLLRFLGWPLPF